MKTTFQTLAIIGLVTGLSACAFTPEQITLQPQITPTANANIGNGKAIAVEVIDERPETSLGARPSGFGPAADISLASDIVTTVETTVNQGLNEYGFKPVAYNPNANPQLVLHILALEYDPRASIDANIIIVNSTIEVTATNNGQVYDHIYRGQGNSSTFFTPTSNQDSQTINEAFSDTLNQILQDQQLMRFLAQS